MINLIPRSAKKSIKVEYLVRVATAWLLLFSLALVCSIGILLPAYVLINTQISVYDKSATEASQKLADYKNVSQSLVQSSQQAKLIMDEKDVVLISDYVTLFESLQGPNIRVSQISLDRDDKAIAPVHISGEATDRKNLAAFRDRLLAEPRITAVDLPISNLADDKDIKFSITVTIANNLEV